MAHTGGVGIQVDMLAVEQSARIRASADELATQVYAALADPEFARSSAGRHLNLALVEYQSSVAELRRGRVEHRG